MDVVSIENDMWFEQLTLFKLLDWTSDLERDVSGFYQPLFIIYVLHKSSINISKYVLKIFDLQIMEIHFTDTQICQINSLLNGPEAGT